MVLLTLTSVLCIFSPVLRRLLVLMCTLYCHLLLPVPAPGNHHSVCYFSEFGFCRSHMGATAQSICPCLTRLTEHSALEVCCHFCHQWQVSFPLSRAQADAAGCLWHRVSEAMGTAPGCRVSALVLTWCLLASIRPLMAVSWRHQFLVTWLLPEQEIQNSPPPEWKEARALLILELTPCYFCRDLFMRSELQSPAQTQG